MGALFRKGVIFSSKKSALADNKKTCLMPGKPSLGALLHIYSPRYVKSGPGDLPERPEKSPTLWGPLTRIISQFVLLFFLALMFLRF